MKNLRFGISKATYSIIKKIDTISSFRGETAPYCGYAYSGHSGKLTSGRYNEGDGGESVNTNLFYLGLHSDEGHAFSLKLHKSKDIIFEGKKYAPNAGWSVYISSGFNFSLTKSANKHWSSRELTIGWLKIELRERAMPLDLLLNGA